ncbi:hypothetical protein G6R29_03320 [Fructobacillus sp. M2-14]|uniref:ComX n=2 Tax=Fructobacillus broussonetiae TaxID=2713173 RepID=A0ABS5QZQ2_9LACO|nr:hypothetical protein [Fructobacillus broussonetiae]
MLAAVLAGQNGHDCAFTVLHVKTRGLVFKVYDEQLAGQFRPDDWESEALLTLADCVRCYSVKDTRAKFSTYYTQALFNKARDIKRGLVSQKGRFYSEMLDFDNSFDKDSNFQTDSYNPEKIYQLKEALLSVSSTDRRHYRDVVAFLIGRGEDKGLRKNRSTAQVLYRFKKNVLKALKEG